MLSIIMYEKAVADVTIDPVSKAMSKSLLQCTRDARGAWEAIRPPFSTSFHGALSDLRALDYMDYEGLGIFPDRPEVVETVWGNVLAALLDLKWGQTGIRNATVLCLYAPPEFEYDFLCVPAIEVAKVYASPSPQDDKMRWSVAAEMLRYWHGYSSCSIDEDRIDRIARDIREVSPDSLSYLALTAACIEEVSD